MISRVRGTLLSRGEGRVEVGTPGGVVYEIEVPLTVAERLPPEGERVELHTVHVVRDDHQALYGLLARDERTLFQLLIRAKGVGGKNALSMLSTYSASRLATILGERNVAALTAVSGIGKKTAERILLDLADRVAELELVGAGPDAGSGAGDDAARSAVQALTALGIGVAEAERAVHAALRDGDPEGPDDLIRRALAER